MNLMCDAYECLQPQLEPLMGVAGTLAPIVKDPDQAFMSDQVFCLVCDILLLSDRLINHWWKPFAAASCGHVTAELLFDDSWSLISPAPNGMPLGHHSAE